MSRPSPTAVTQSPKWDALLAAIVVVLLLQVWRIQGLAKGVPLFGAPILATAAAVALFAFDRDPRRRVGRFSQPVIRVTVGIVIMVVLSIPTSLHPALSASFLLKDYLRSVILMLLIAWSVRGLVDVRRLAWVQMVGVALCALAIVTHSATGEGRLSTEQTYYDENDLATLIVCTLPLVLYLWRRPTGLFGRAVLAGITLFLMTTLGRTGSRGGFLGFLMVALYLLLRFSTISTAKRVGAVAVLSILLVSLASDQYFARIETILHPSKDYNWSGKSETGRMEIWKRGVGYMMDNPIVGVGANAFPKADGTLSPEAQERMRYGRGFKWSTAHNSFLQIGAELGVMGLVLLLLLFVDVFRLLAWVRRWTRGEIAILAQVLTACCVGFFVTALFLSQAYSAYLYSLLGMSLAVARLVPVAPRGVVAAPGGTPSPGQAFPLAGGLGTAR
jgi:O-antigen ligase